MRLTASQALLPSSPLPPLRPTSPPALTPSGRGAVSPCLVWTTALHALLPSSPRSALVATLLPLYKARSSTISIFWPSDIPLFNIVPTLPTISRFWQDTALTNHISEGPVLPLLQGNQYGTCCFEQGGELFDAIVVSKQGRFDEVA